MPESRPELVTLEAFRREARPGVALRKAFTAVVKAEGDPAEQKLSIRITTATRDRQGDTIAAGGWKLANFRKNPVVLWSHDYSGLPIAKDEGLTVDELGLIGTPRFTSQDENPFGAMVYRLMKAGYLSAASVGFAPEKWVFNEVEQGIDFVEQELLEYSIVPVPANAEALMGAKAAGIDLAPLKAWAEQVLDTWHDCKGLWLPRAKVESVLALLEPRKLVVPADISTEFVLELAKQLPPGVILERAEKVTPTDAPVAPVPPTADPAKPAEPATPVAQPDGDSTDLVFVLEEPDAPEPLVFELVEDDEPAVGDLIEVSAETLRPLLQAAVDTAVGSRLTALTGRLD